MSVGVLMVSRGAPHDGSLKGMYSVAEPNILLTRIDNRLIHGQVVTQWNAVVGANLILVANDGVAKSDVRQRLMDRLGKRLGRVQAGIFTLENALDRDQIDAAYQNGTLSECLLPVDAPIGHIPAVYVDERARHAVKNGNVLRPQWLREPAPAVENVRIYLEDQFAGIGEPLPDGSVRFRMMLLREEDA